MKIFHVKLSVKLIWLIWREGKKPQSYACVYKCRWPPCITHCTSMRKWHYLHFIFLHWYFCSERADPMCKYNKGRLKEGTNINKSLVTLGSVIQALGKDSVNELQICSCTGTYFVAGERYLEHKMFWVLVVLLGSYNSLRANIGSDFIYSNEKLVFWLI